jgi:hypothetical protein
VRAKQPPPDREPTPAPTTGPDLHLRAPDGAPTDPPGTGLVSALASLLLERARQAVRRPAPDKTPDPDRGRPAAAGCTVPVQSEHRPE